MELCYFRRSFVVAYKDWCDAQSWREDKGIKWDPQSPRLYRISPRIKISGWAFISCSYSETIFDFDRMCTTKSRSRFSGFSFWFSLEHQAFEQRWLKMRRLWGCDCLNYNWWAMREIKSFSQGLILCKVLIEHLNGTQMAMSAIHSITLQSGNTVKPLKSRHPRDHSSRGVSDHVNCLF